MRKEVADLTARADSAPVDCKNVTTDHDKKEGEYGYKWAILYVPRWAQKRRRFISSSANAVYDALASCADLTFDALGGPSYKKIADATGVNLHRISYHINELIAAVLIKRVQRRRTGTKYEIIRSEAHALDEELHRPKAILEAKRSLKRYKKARKARKSKLLENKRGARIVRGNKKVENARPALIENARPALIENARPALIVPADTLSLLPFESLPLSLTQQQQAHPLTDVSPIPEPIPPTVAAAAVDKVCAEKVEKLTPAPISTPTPPAPAVPAATARNDDEEKIKILRRCLVSEPSAARIVQRKGAQRVSLDTFAKLATICAGKRPNNPGGWWTAALDEESANPGSYHRGPDEAALREQTHRSEFSRRAEEKAERERREREEAQRELELQAHQFVYSLSDGTMRRYAAEVIAARVSGGEMISIDNYPTEALRNFKGLAVEIFQRFGSSTTGNGGGLTAAITHVSKRKRAFKRS
jgi:hypothetical protein